jgi:Dyp-type peroxidase family
MATDPAAGKLTTSQIQGNILAPFRCSHQAFLFIGFRHRRDDARRWLGDVAGRVSSTDDVRRAKQKWYLNIGLTATGLVVLHPELAGDLSQFTAFWSGPLGSRHDDAGALTTTAALLSDVDASAPTSWVVGGSDRPPIDALLTLAAGDGKTLRAQIEQEGRKAKAQGLDVVLVEEGHVLRNERRQSVDHFGFADGISQPGIRGYSRAEQVDGRLQDADRPGSPIIAAGEFVLGYPGERRPPTSTARPTPPSWMRDGSFQVFRRLRQDVAGWRQRITELSAYGSGEDEVEAKAIGRRRDGNPLVPGADPKKPNKFSYTDDQHGWYTPFYAHIRKMNPRDDSVFRDRCHKLLRRGVSFGPMAETDQPDGLERGLFFNAYMTSIEEQFEFLQRRWANDPQFPARTLAQFTEPAATSRTVSGLDPVVGDDARAARQRFGKRIVRDIPPPALGGFVTTTGAVYAFAPSLSALKSLAGKDRL